MKFRSIKDIENFIPKKGSFKHYLRKIEEEGRIVKGVNTTVDVGVNQVPIEAKKLGNTVDKDGRPPTLSTKVKGKSTNVLFNLGLAESKIDNINESVLYLLHNLKENMGEISKTTKIYVDMDGVLADFFTAWADLMGKDSYRDIKDIGPALQKIKDTDDFWLNLPLTKNAMALLSVIKQVKGEYNILSSPLPGDPNSEPHKRVWIQKHLSKFMPTDVIITHDKPKYATNKDGTPNILIDDYGVNISAWDAAGGIGFKHKDHKFERTAKAIKQKVTANEGEAIPNPKDTFLTKADTAYDSIRVGKSISNLSNAKKTDNRDEPDVMIIPFGGKKEKEHLKKGLKKAGYNTQDADKPGDDTQVDEELVKDKKQPNLKEPSKPSKYTKRKQAFTKDKEPVKTENFADGKKKGKSKPGRVKKSGASCNGSVTKLRKQAKTASGEKAKMYHWCANMKSGRKKK